MLLIKAAELRLIEKATQSFFPSFKFLKYYKIQMNMYSESPPIRKNT